MPFPNLDKVGHLLLFVKSLHKKNKLILERFGVSYKCFDVVFMESKDKDFRCADVTVKWFSNDQVVLQS